MCQGGGGPNGGASTSAPVRTWTFGSASAADASMLFSARVRERGADEGDGQRPLEREILDVGSLASKEPWVLHAEHAIAQDAHGWRA